MSAASATQLRRDLFQTLDQVLEGDPVEINYKGTTVRIAAVSSATKLSRAVRRNILLVDPQLIIESDQSLMQEMEEDWKRKDSQL